MDVGSIPVQRGGGWQRRILALTVVTIAGFVGLLSLANMLPIPALDGGRLLFVIIEAVRGKRVSPEKEAAVHFVGLVALLALMILISLRKGSAISSPFAGRRTHLAFGGASMLQLARLS